MTVHIVPETPADATAIEQLTEACFGRERHKRAVYRFRDGNDPLRNLCFAARDVADNLVGSLRFWPVLLPDGRQVPLFGPLAVRLDLRGQGVGRKLAKRGLEAAEQAGFFGVLLVGDPGYYAPLGFSTTVVKGLNLPGPVHPLTFMGVEFTGPEEAKALSRTPGLIRPLHPA